MGNTSRIDERNRRQVQAMNDATLERLRSDDSVQVLCEERLQLFGVPDFFSADECERLMRLIDAVARPSPVFSVDYGRAARTSFSGDMIADDPFIRSMHRRMDDLVGVDENFGETLQGQRYQVGQEFRPHHDWFDTTQEYWTPEVAQGGQRAWTLMAYLNDVEEGGNTDFPRADISVPPQAGTLILWSNALANGKPNPDTLHAGTPVRKGVKYVVTRWYRGRKWY